MIELLAPALDLLQIAHDTQLPHEEPVSDSSGGGASTVVIVAGVVATLVLVGALVWLKNRAS